MKRGHAAQPRLGLTEWFQRGEYERVETVLSDAKQLGVQDLRICISWADWCFSEGDGWYSWLLPRLAKEVQVLPCVTHTPPPLGLVPKTASPPASPKAYADFIDVLITQFGEYFEWIELWNQPSSPQEWDSRLDPDWLRFSQMIGGAAYWIQSRGKKAVLPGMWPADLEWLDLMKSRGVLEYIDAVGLHGLPGATEFPWRGWDREISDVRARVAQLSRPPEIWITLTGYSTWRADEREQVQAFLDAASAPASRVYWWGARDHVPAQSPLLSSSGDERDHHYGASHADGTRKLLFSFWSGSGANPPREQKSAKLASPRHRKKHVLITGGAGFIGTNLASRLLSRHRQVLVYDNLSRNGAGANLDWLRDQYSKGLLVEIADLLDESSLRTAVRSAEEVYHFAAQVAVTSSLTDPMYDFEVNVLGTVRLLQILRNLEHPPPILFTSTNKVYGALSDLTLTECGTRYQPLDPALRTGINESRPLDFHSPYGCSKGAADQYVLDSARTFGLPAAVFRMSCVYGVHQNGTEDQGWVAHFVKSAISRQPITIYGNGLQVRDLLYVDDLVEALILAQSNIHTLSGQAFNIGGGLGNTVSLIDLVEILSQVGGEKPDILNGEFRLGDQRYYVSDTGKFRRATGWAPKIGVHLGVKRLYQWLVEQQMSTQKWEASRYGGLDAVFAD